MWSGVVWVLASQIFPVNATCLTFKWNFFKSVIIKVSLNSRSFRNFSIDEDFSLFHIESLLCWVSVNPWFRLLSLGGELFAKRRKKADKWVVDEQNVGSTTSQFASQVQNSFVHHSTKHFIQLQILLRLWKTGNEITVSPGNSEIIALVLEGMLDLVIFKVWHSRKFKKGDQAF